MPKHYFNKTFYMDFYATGRRDLDTINKVSKHLKSYKVSQSTLGFVIPVLTKDIYNKDSTNISNLHFFVTGMFCSVKLDFGGISTHYLSKSSIGFRGMYNNGRKSIFFIEASPFVTQDRGYAYTQTYRLAATLIYDYAATPAFSMRLGITRSFLWGNRYHLPYIGIRMGKLDRVNFSIQFPRSASLNIPIGKHIRTSLFMKPQGGLYTFGNDQDSIRVGDYSKNQKLFFGRNEFLSGMRIDVMPSKYFNFYLSTGFTTKNTITLYPSDATTSKLTLYRDYYNQKIKPSIFFNVGLVLRFGKTRSVYHNYQMYEAKDLNNSIDPGDNGVHQGNGDIPAPAKKIKKINPAEVLDLIETQDLY